MENVNSTAKSTGGTPLNPIFNYKIKITVKGIIKYADKEIKYGRSFHYIRRKMREFPRQLKYIDQRYPRKYGHNYRYDSMLADVVHAFFDQMLTEVIQNNIIFEFYNHKAWIVIAKKPVTGRGWKYNMKTGHGGAGIYLIFRRKIHDFDHALTTGRFLLLGEKHWTMLQQEIEAGHEYPELEDVRKYLFSYGR